MAKGKTAQDMTCKDIAEKIRVHLARFEHDPVINKPRKEGGTRPYYNAGATATGRFVRVQYVSYQGGRVLDKQAALAYLAWLEQGNVGRHFDV